jgi:RNA polymerase sigma-70 factor, ECF subfamily
MDIDPRDWQRHRRYLLAVAYRLLGTVTEAEDAVQEAYLRLRRDDVTGVPDVRSWLVTMVSRICLDELRSARPRRESYIGTWLPEPLVGDILEPEPADRVPAAESVDLAVLVVLETVTPAERAAFVLHDVFGIDVPQIAEVVRRREPACRQLVSRVRRQVQVETPRSEIGADELRAIASAFMTATARGEPGRLVGLLDPDVVLRSDGGGVVPAARRPAEGAENVARLLIGLSEMYAGARVRLVPVNDRPGFVLYDSAGWLLGVMAVAVADRRIAQINLVLNPDKLRHVSAQSLDGPEWTIPGMGASSQ